MSVKNFVPEIWSANIEKSLDEFLVAADFCNRSYEGEVKEAGDLVRVNEAIRPTIIESADGKAIDMSTPENPDGTQIAMPIIYQAGFNYSVNDVDKAQAKGNLGAVLKGEATQGVANAIDKRILKLAKENVVKKSTAVTITTSNVLDEINKGLAYLYSKNVPANAALEIIVSPNFHRFFLGAYEKLDTDNSAMIKAGTVGRYGNCTVKMSNNLYNDGTYDYILIRTNKAFAYACPSIITEAIPNPTRLGDVVRGRSLYGCKVMRPDEAYVIKAQY